MCVCVFTISAPIWISINVATCTNQYVRFSKPYRRRYADGLHDYFCRNPFFFLFSLRFACAILKLFLNGHLQPVFVRLYRTVCAATERSKVNDENYHAVISLSCKEIKTKYANANTHTRAIPLKTRLTYRIVNELKEFQQQCNVHLMALIFVIFSFTHKCKFCFYFFMQEKKKYRKNYQIFINQKICAKKN